MKRKRSCRLEPDPVEATALDHELSRQGAVASMVLWSLALVALLCSLLWGLSGRRGGSTGKEPLTVYCAAGVMLPVGEAAALYEQEYGVPVLLQHGSSGALESKIEIYPKGDLYVPAAIDPFLNRCREKGLIAEILPLAQFRLVLAVRPGNQSGIRSLQDLLRPDVGYAVANHEAAVGQKTEELLTKAGQWKKIKDGAKVFKDTVTNLAQDIRLGVGVDAGFIWDSTAKQFGLEIVELPELKGGESTIGVGVLAGCEHPASALRFARYLASPEKGQPSFTQHNYAPVPGDPWAERPELTLYSGGVNRLAIQESIREFQNREGCSITENYNGCGVLVGMMKSGQNPDAYFACDVSFVKAVEQRFHDPVNVSQTDMVILVRPNNPRNIQSLSDLAQEGLDVGLADDKLTALGRLTRHLLEETGIYEAVLENRRATTPTADLLVTQLIANDKLDAIVVYEANCARVGDQAEIVRIEHRSARAIQPFAVHRENRFPQLTNRLLDWLTTKQSRARFETVGFRWLAEP